MQLEEIKSQLNHLLQNQKSLYIASLDLSGTPHCSTTPFLIQNQKIYILLSELSLHCQNILAQSKLSILITEDEGAADEIFARTRVNWTVKQTEILRETQTFDEILELMKGHLSPVVKMLKSLKDFHLFELEPKAGRLILGFGKAFNLNGFHIDSTPIGPKK